MKSLPFIVLDLFINLVFYVACILCSICNAHAEKKNSMRTLWGVATHLKEASKISQFAPFKLLSAINKKIVQELFYSKIPENCKNSTFKRFTKVP
uniref:Putative secreted protein n=1 Tax=Ixodes ricinus TaxID=34613 RepID=A0A6B0UCT9_IXORI